MSMVKMLNTQMSAVSEETNSARIKKPFKCTECDSRFTTNAARNIHSKTHTGYQVFKCSLCPYGTTNYNNLRKHRLNFCYDGKYKNKIVRCRLMCRLCDYVCYTKRMLKLHFSHTHTGPKIPSQCTDCDFKTLDINCTVCDFVCDSQTVIHAHITKLHPDESNSAKDIDQGQGGEDDGEKTVNKYGCDSCDFMCSSLSNIKKHLSKEHSGDNHNNLQEDEDHQVFEVSDEKLLCPECGLQCSSMLGIKVHFGLMHNYLKLNNVVKLRKGHVTYKRTEELLEPKPIGIYSDPGNEKINEDNISRTYACYECNYKGTWYTVKTHKICTRCSATSHTVDAKKKCRIKKLRCFYNDCDFMSYTYKDIKKHAKEHTDIKEIECEDTGEKKLRYIKKKPRNEQFRCLYNGCEFVSITIKGIVSHANSHFIVKPFACKECEFTCFTQKVLSTHISRKHGDDAFACSKCDYIGHSSIGLSRHSIKAHNMWIHFDKISISKKSPTNNPSKLIAKDNAFAYNESVNLDSDHAVKLEIDATGDESDYFMEVKVEEFPIQVGTEMEVNSKLSVNLDQHQMVKLEMDAPGDDFDYHMDVKVEEHPID